MDDDPVVDLFEVVDSLARTVGGPAALADADFRILAYSAVPGQPNDDARRSAVLNRRTPDRWLRWMDASGLRERLLTSDEVIPLEVPWPAFRQRWIKSIRTSDGLLGFLWVMQGAEMMAPDLVQSMHDFATLLSPELARRSSAQAENPGGDLFRQFLRGALSAARIAEVLDTSVGVTNVVVVFAFQAGRSEEISVRNRAIRALNLQTQLYQRLGLVCADNQHVYLLEVGDRESIERFTSTGLQALVGHLEDTLGSPVRAAAGSIRTDLAEAEDSRREADLTLTAMAGGWWPDRVGSFPELRSAIVLQQVCGLLHSQPTLIAGLLDPLVEHDEEHGSDYIPTLGAYLDCFGDVRAAAGRLRVHPNSLRYRIRRIGELAGFDLTDADQRLVVQIALTASRPG